MRSTNVSATSDQAGRNTPQAHELFAADAIEICRRLIGFEVTGIDWPGGKSRPSLRARSEEDSVIVTRRKDPKRAELEARVLHQLRAHGASVPRIIAFDGAWLIQEDLGQRRLSQEIAVAPPTTAEAWLGRALESLAEIQAAGRAAGLAQRVVKIGWRREWLESLVDRPRRLGIMLDRPAPTLPSEAMLDFLKPRAFSFIKWDARPGNAMALDNGDVAWFDWEYCGCRDPLDDAAWLLGDEYTVIAADAEERLLERCLPLFRGHRDLANAREYLSVYGALHMCVRLELIFRRKGKKGWWSDERCLALDRVGVTPTAAMRSLERAKRWAERSGLTSSLVPWFQDLAAEFQTAIATPTT